jgi:hypothetical protein
MIAALGYHPALPAYGLCDGQTLRVGPLNGVVGTPNGYRWSPDNQAEVRRGWIIGADSPAAGRDDRFGRHAEYMAPSTWSSAVWPASTPPDPARMA